MALPGFNAETSFYRTSVHYRLMGGSVHANGVMLQQFARCGPCYRNWQINPNTGACVQDCTSTICELFAGCFTSTWTEACSESACPVGGGIPVGNGNGTGGGHGVPHS